MNKLFFNIFITINTFFNNSFKTIINIKKTNYAIFN